MASPVAICDLLFCFLPAGKYKIITLIRSGNDLAFFNRYHQLSSTTMKKLFFTLVSLHLIVLSWSQSFKEMEIRKLEDEQRKAFLKKDTAALYKLFSKDFIVHAPTNKITTLAQLKMLISTGQVDMEIFERVTEKVTFAENIAIAMGHETLKPTGNMPNTGKTVKRRYTNIWMKAKKSWQLVARQSTIISVE